jgi:protein-L-isoaspartate(D-aspartate) O-methyltransferase
MEQTKWLRTLLISLGLVVAGYAETAGEDPFAERRSRMVQVIEHHGSTAGSALGGQALDPRVLEVMKTVPRHEFVPRSRRAEAYADRPLPIGHGQTISQPFIVALMTDLLDVRPDDVVLEVGTGSGYQAAVLSPLAHQVYSIEIIPALQRAAADRLERLGYKNVQTRLGDGYYGWEEHAPFDGIVVTAAAANVPPPLIQQLKPGRQMVIPVGGRFTAQQLMLVRKDVDGRVTTRQLLPVRFVPLTGQHP